MKGYMHGPTEHDLALFYGEQRLLSTALTLFGVQKHQLGFYGYTGLNSILPRFTKEGQSSVAP